MTLTADERSTCRQASSPLAVSVPRPLSGLALKCGWPRGGGDNGHVAGESANGVRLVQPLGIRGPGWSGQYRWLLVIQGVLQPVRARYPALVVGHGKHRFGGGPAGRAAAKLGAPAAETVGEGWASF